jgi:hypothetical protein
MKAGGAAPENRNIIESAVVVSDSRVLPENEGKVVLVTGTLEAPLPFVDPETGVVIDSIVAYRYVEKARVVLGKDDEKDTWTWDATSELGGSQKLIAPGVTIGEFAVAEELMYPVPNLKQRDDYSASDLAEGGWNEFRDKGLSYLYRMDYMPREGDEVYRDTFRKEYATSKQKNEGTLRLRYNVVEDGASMEYTIIGLQQDGKLEKVPGLDLISTVSGHLTPEEMLGYAESSNTTALITATVITLAFAIPGVIMLVKAFKGGHPAAKGKKHT